MSNKTLETLRLIFEDQPDILEIIKLSDLESERLVSILGKNNELFAKPVNLYVTGRTGAGKTSLGNCLLEQDVMKSSGFMDCTDSVGLFKLASHLCYFDLPGSGSNDDFENINRVALMIPQLEEEDLEITPITNFVKIDFSNTKHPIKETVSVEDWQSRSMQEQVNPDAILYVVASHMQFLRNDKEYLRDLLKYQKKASCKNKVIFAINIFRDEHTSREKHTPQNLQDIKNKINEVYKKIYEAEAPIVEFDAKTGDGLNKITALICEILPKEKLGNIQQVLRSELKEFAKVERNQRYQKTLIRIASRLASYKVDQKVGSEDLLKIAASAISTYGVETFKNQEELFQIYTELNQIIEVAAQEIQETQKNDIKIIENLTEEKELSREKPIIKQEKVTEYIEVNEPKIERGNFFEKFIDTTLTFFGFGKVFEKVVPEKVKKPIERLETRFLGYEKEVIGTVKVVVGHVEKIVGKDYLKGGYPVIKFIIGLGRGVQIYCHNPERSLQNCIENAEAAIENQLIPFKARIEQLLENNATHNAEQQLIQILEKALGTSK
jgi:predicted GTPase